MREKAAVAETEKELVALAAAVGGKDADAVPQKLLLDVCAADTVAVLQLLALIPGETVAESVPVAVSEPLPL